MALVVLERPLVDILGAVDAVNDKVAVAVIKRVVFGFPAFGSVIRVRIFKLLVKKFCRLRIISADTFLLRIHLKAAVVVIAKRHHIGDMLDYTRQSAEHTVPLNLVLTAVGVVAAC